MFSYELSTINNTFKSDLLYFSCSFELSSHVLATRKYYRPEVIQSEIDMNALRICGDIMKTGV